MSEHLTKQKQLGLSAYVVLFADFGTEKNCYTPVMYLTCQMGGTCS